MSVKIFFFFLSKCFILLRISCDIDDIVKWALGPSNTHTIPNKNKTHRHCNISFSRLFIVWVGLTASILATWWMIANFVQEIGQKHWNPSFCNKISFLTELDAASFKSINFKHVVVRRKIGIFFCKSCDRRNPFFSYNQRVVNIVIIKKANFLLALYFLIIWQLGRVSTPFCLDKRIGNKFLLIWKLLYDILTDSQQRDNRLANLRHSWSHFSYLISIYPLSFWTLGPVTHLH